MIISAMFCPRLCRICPRSSVDQPESTVGSAIDYCRVCMQRWKSLCADFCSARAAEEGSGIFWIMIELTDLQNKESKGVRVCTASRLYSFLQY